MNVLIAWCGIVLLNAVNYWVGSWRVRQILAKERACPNPIHRAEAAQRAAVNQVGVVAVTAWTAVLMVAVTLMPVGDSAGMWWATLLGSLLLGMAGVVVVAVWKTYRCRALGLTESLCS